MAKKKVQRDRYLGDEIWDLDGQRWVVLLGRRTRQECELIVAGQGQLVVHEQGDRLQWLSQAAGQQWWAEHLDEVYFSDQPDRPMPRHGFSWDCSIYESGDRQLLLIDREC